MTTILETVKNATVKNATKIYQNLKDHADKIKSGEPQVIDTCNANDTHWQGDLGIQFLGSEKPEFLNDGWVKCHRPKQIVPGDTTGSRHVLHQDCNIVNSWTHSNPLICSVVEAPDGVKVDHPEHGDVTLKEPGFYLFKCQRAYADELARVRD